MIKILKQTICLILLIITIASCRREFIPNGSSTAVPLSQFRVIGYLPSWQGNISDLQVSRLTHVTYAFLIPTAAGGYYPLDDTARLDSMVTTAHAHKVKAIISVGGSDSSFAFSGIVATQANRTAFVNNMISFTTRYKLDGVDIDWEYPAAGAEAGNFLLLMQQLSTALHQKGRLLSMAVIGEGGSYVDAGVFAVTDYFEIMAYDNNNFQHSTFQLGQDCINYWLGRGMPPAKATLGVPFYGHKSLVSFSDPNAEVEYNTLIDSGANSSLDVSGGTGYNGLITMRSKASYALSKTGGLAIWELSGDATGANSLLTAISQVIAASGQISVQAPVGKVISLQTTNKAYVSSENGLKAMTATSQAIGQSERFTVNDDGYCRNSLQNSGFYVSSEK